jgi:cell division protein FtsL
MGPKENVPEARPADRLDLGPLVDLVKATAFIGGSVGSLTLLFFWLGNAIIVARLRVYNLYGVIRYADEYIREAGYQLLQDVFTFFDRWEYFVLFIFSLGLIFLIVPMGPYPQASPTGNKPRRQTGKLAVRDLGRSLLAVWLRYVLFALLALIMAVLLASNAIVYRLRANIADQERYLSQAQQIVSNTALLFRAQSTELLPGLPVEVRGDLPSDPMAAVAVRREWIREALVGLYGDEARQGEWDLPINRFRADYRISELSDPQDKSFLTSETAGRLIEVRTNLNLNRLLQTQIAEALFVFKAHLSGHLMAVSRSSDLLWVPAVVSEFVNPQLAELRALVDGIERSFSPATPETRKLIKTLGRLRPIQYGGAALSLSFWVLLGLLMYLLLNGSKILRFSRWEQVYYFCMALLFVFLAVAIPSNYGRYKFEFMIHRLNRIIFAEDKSSSDLSIQSQFDNLLKDGAPLYILGPTRGKEIFIGLLPRQSPAATSDVQFMILDREAIRYMALEPVSPWTVSRLIVGMPGFSPPKNALP